MLDHNKRNQKKLRRKENKKKKLRALLEISSLNDQDRKKSSSHDSGESVDKFSATKELKTLEEPNPKRMKREFLYPLNGLENSTKDNMESPSRTITEDQHTELKKLLKLRKKMRLERPYLELNDVGEAAAVTLPESQRIPLPFEDYQNLLITSHLNHKGTNGSTRWISCKKYQKIDRRICLVIEGTGLKEYFEKKSDLKTLAQFEKQLEFLTPLQYGGDLISELALVTNANSHLKKLASEYGSLKEAYSSRDLIESFKFIFPINDKCVMPPKVKSDKELEKEEVIMSSSLKDKFSRVQLLLKPWDMLMENYPLPYGEIGKECVNFIYTCDNYKVVDRNSPMWALDCEMCLTIAGSELTRICIVDENSNIVYETLVKPYNPIKNYLTQFSGITPAMMKDVTTRLENVQADIRSICPPDLIIVGQSLNNDLFALKMMHPYVIDTSVIFNMSGNRRRKTALRVLVEEFLSLLIQTEDNCGHCPIEDAVASMKLVQEKLLHSPEWGNAVLSGARPKEESTSARTLLKTRLAAGMARISTVDSKRLVWPQLSVNGKSRNNLSRSSWKIFPSGVLPQVNVRATPLFSHLVRNDKNAVFTAKSSDLDKWAGYYSNLKRFHVETAESNRYAVKYLRDNTPVNGTGIAYLSLVNQPPAEAILKADKLVNKLMKNTKPNSLYSIFLAGSPGNSGNGMLLLHLARETYPCLPQLVSM